MQSLCVARISTTVLRNSIGVKIPGINLDCLKCSSFVFWILFKQDKTEPQNKHYYIMYHRVNVKFPSKVCTVRSLCAAITLFSVSPFLFQPSSIIVPYLCFIRIAFQNTTMYKCKCISTQAKRKNEIVASMWKWKFFNQAVNVIYSNDNWWHIQIHTRWCVFFSVSFILCIYINFRVNLLFKVPL